jgi:hypothetical protein
MSDESNAKIRCHGSRAGRNVGLRFRRSGVATERRRRFGRWCGRSGRFRRRRQQLFWVSHCARNQLGWNGSIKR